MLGVVLLGIGLLGLTVAYIIVRLNPAVLAAALGDEASIVSASGLRGVSSRAALQPAQPAAPIMSNERRAYLYRRHIARMNVWKQARTDVGTPGRTDGRSDVEELRDILRAEIWAELAAEVRERQRKSLYSFVDENWVRKNGRPVRREDIYGLMGMRDEDARAILNSVAQQWQKDQAVKLERQHAKDLAARVHEPTPAMEPLPG